MARSSAEPTHLSLPDWCKYGAKPQHEHYTQIESLAYLMRHLGIGTWFLLGRDCQDGVWSQWEPSILIDGVSDLTRFVSQTVAHFHGTLGLL
jgi:hypothetical protein